MANGVKQTNGGAHPDTRELVEQTERVREDLNKLAETARQAMQGWRDLLRERLEQQPYATLAVAAGLGYVLGGGLPTSLLRAVVGFGGRMAIDHFLVQMAGSAVNARSPRC